MLYSEATKTQVIKNLANIIGDLPREFHDAEDKAPMNISCAYHLMQRSSLGEDELVQARYEAWSTIKVANGTGKVAVGNSRCLHNRTPYFFAALEDWLELSDENEG